MIVAIQLERIQSDRATLLLNSETCHDSNTTQTTNL
jgi:hypothetical protein